MRLPDVIEMFRARVDERPDDTAAVGPFGAISYRELETRANRIANLLLAEGLIAGGRVAVLSDEPAATLAAIIAVMSAGGAFVPLDLRLPAGRMSEMLAIADVGWCFTQSRHLALLESLAAGLDRRPLAVCEDAASANGSPRLAVAPSAERFADGSRPAIALDPDSMFAIHFTSGSTGAPKGISARLKAVGHFIRWEIEALGLEPGVRVSQLTTPTFDPYLRDVFTPLCAGGTVCFPDSPDTAADPPALVRYLERREVNVLHCVPAVLRGLIGRVTPGALPALRHVFCGGEPLLPADVSRWYEAFGDRGRLVNIYGPTETMMTKFFHFVSREDARRERVPIGGPMPGASAAIIDGEGRECPPGEIGEIHIRTPYAALGYFGRPDLTERSFYSHCQGEEGEERGYRTGDLGIVGEDGLYYFLGRADRQVKVAGVRIELEEIESRLLSRGEIREAAVIDCPLPSGGAFLYGYIVAPGGCDTAALRRWLGAYLPAPAVPLGFTILERLPRTIRGKVARDMLPAPELHRSASDRAYREPSTRTEKLMAEIWSDVFGTESLGAGEDFFELGGHSIMATQIIVRIATIFGAELPVRAVFESPTVEKLARRVEEALDRRAS